MGANGITLSDLTGNPAAEQTTAQVTAGATTGEPGGTTPSSSPAQDPGAQRSAPAASSSTDQKPSGNDGAPQGKPATSATPTPPPTPKQEARGGREAQASSTNSPPIAGAVKTLALLVIVTTLIGFLWNWHTALLIGAIGLLIASRILVPRLVPKTPGRPVPSLGWRARWYKVLNNPLVGVAYTPQLSDEELLQNEVSAEMAKHVELRQQVPHIEFGSFGTRGGSGKGTSASNMAGVAAEASPDPTLIVDSRHTVGNIAPRFGLVSRKDGADFNAYLPHATPTVRQCIALWKAGMFQKSVETRNLLGSFKGYPLWVIAADVRDRNNREAIKRPDVVVTDFTGMMDELANDFSLALFECNNDEGHDFDLALMRRVDIPVFVYRVNHEYNLDELHGNLEAYRSDPELDRKIQGFGILLVLAATPRQTREQFADEFGFSADQVFLVRKDSYFVIGDEDGFDADGNSKRLRTLNTDSPAREPIIRPRLTPLHAKLQYLRAVNHGLELVLLAKYQKEPLTITLPQAA